MITRDQADQLREELLAVLAEDARNTDRLLSRLESLTQESGIGAHAALLLILTHMAFSEVEAKEHWLAILAHRDELSGALGRDVGVRTAIVDYFINVNRRLVQPTLIDLEMFDSAEGNLPNDPLTGLIDDRSFRRALQMELRRAKRYRERVSVVLFDLDDFAEVNGTHGRLIADRALRESAIVLKNCVRDIDLAGRPGEDEAALLLPETDRNGAFLVAERFRLQLAAYFRRRETSEGSMPLTVSGGIAAYPDDAATQEELLSRAAQALYRAKSLGKNQIQLYHPERRRFVRFDLEPGRFEVEVLSRARRTAGDARNLSLSGIMFESPEPLEVGEWIEIRLIEAGDAPSASHRVRATVVRLEELPEDPLDETSARTYSGDGHDRNRFEVGVAFDRSDLRREGELLELLERIHAGRR